MDAVTIIILVVLVVVLAVAIVGGVLMRRRRSAQLQSSFGSEYDRTLDNSESRGEAEKHLRQREKRRGRFEVTALSADAAGRYREEWNGVQQRFVDAPGNAVEQADSLVVRIMRERGYPVDDFDQRAEDISVDHPEVVQHYREAHGVAVAQTQGKADTEQLRLAVTSYRALVGALLETTDSSNSNDRSNGRERANESNHSPDLTGE